MIVFYYKNKILKKKKKTVAGSKSGAPIAGAWFAMMHLGKAGYRKCA